jgi:hypothetical protein
MKLVVPVVVAIGVLTGFAAAETPDERDACIGDAFRVCGAAIPDRDRVTACMITNMNQLGAVCRAVMKQYSAHDPTKGAPVSRSTINFQRQ